MALTANVQRETRTTQKAAPQIVNAAVLYSGAVVAVGSRNHATATSRGRCLPWASTAGQIPFGWAVGDVKTGATASTPIPEADLDIAGRVVTRLAVTGLGGTFADVGRLVYASDDGTFTLTKPTVGIPHGMIVRFSSATLADVLFFSVSELAVLALSGGVRQTWLLGSVTGVIAGNINVMTGFVAPHAAIINSVYGIVAQPAAGAGATNTYAVSIGGVPTTGGIITWVLADVAGAKLAGTAVTALNVVAEGSLIGVDGTFGTASTAGILNVYADVTTELGL
jgi:hypothetical protein